MAGGLAILLSKAKKAPPAESDDTEDMDSGGGDYSAVGDDILQAIKDGDGGAVGSAVKRLVLQCMAEDNE
jgi:hypothetical protein